MISLCPRCHKVKHPGLSSINGETEIVIKQLMLVNNIKRQEAVKYISDSFFIFDDRSKYRWELDISLLKLLI